MNDAWIVIPNWDKFQHYKNRQPTWIKLYTELDHKPEFRRLTYVQRGLLVTIWIKYALGNGLVQTSSIPRPSGVSGVSMARAFKALEQAEFIELSASKPLAQRESYYVTLSKERASARAVENARARTQKNGSAPKVCPDCEVGGGRHAADCPQVQALDKTLAARIRRPR
jgi:hypothetical protein